MRINAYVLAAEPAYIEASVASYYDIVDTIVVSYDRSGRGWTGAPIPVDECLDRLRSVDVANKMRFCPGDFARLDHTPLENDTYQRQRAHEEASQGADWVLSLDTDEVLPDAREFERRLREEVPREFVAVEWPMRTFFRRADSGLFLEVCTFLRRQLSEYPGTVVSRPGVTHAKARHLEQGPCWRFEIRRTGYDPLDRRSYRAHGVIPKSKAILHFSWARSVEDMECKLKSWSHNLDFDTQHYLDQVWKPALGRWPLMTNFHPIWPRRWPALRPVHLPPELTGGSRKSRAPSSNGDFPGVAVSQPTHEAKDWSRKPIGLSQQPLRLLVVTPELPRPDQQGGDRRLSALLCLLARRHRVTLYPYSDFEDAREDARYRAELQKDGIRVLHGGIWLSGLAEALAENLYDAVLFEFWQTAEAGAELVRRQQPWARIIIDSVDIHFRREAAEVALGLGDASVAAARKRRELAAYGKADVVICVSEEDGRVLDAEGLAIRRFTLSTLTSPRPRSVRCRDPVILFLAGFRHAPNRDGLLWFVHSIWPAIRAAVPAARLSVVGSELSDELANQVRGESVEVLGYVPELTPALDRASLLVAPLRYGAGVKIKVVEALASSLPVVTTSVGVQGLDVVPGKHLELADDPETFASRVVALLGDPERAERIGRAGRDFIATHCFPEAIEPRLEALLNENVAGRRITIPPPDWCLNRVRHSAQQVRSCLGRIRRGLPGPNGHDSCQPSR